MAQEIIPNDLVVQGRIVCSAFSPPAGCIPDAAIPAGANVDPQKLGQERELHYAQASGANVVSEGKVIYTARKAGTVVELDIFPDTAPVGTAGQLGFTVDLQKSTGGGAFASLLTAAYQIDGTKTSRTQYNGSLSGAPAYAAGDALKIVITTNGSGGTQGQGLGVTLTTRESGG